MPARTRTSLALVRPVSALVAALLVGGVALTTPAAADETTGPALTVAVSADGHVGGASADQPAVLGSSPASATLTVVVTNTGSEAVSGLDVVTTVVTNGSAAAPVCDQGLSAALEPGAVLRCAVTVSGVVEGTLHEDATTATARTDADGVEVSAEARFYATAVDGSVGVGDRVWLDSDADGRQDDGEPGLAGVRLVLTSPDGLAVPDLDAPGQVHGPQVSAQDGSYAFTRLAPLPDGGRYTVAVDPTSAVLASLVPTTGGSATSAALAPGEQDLTLDLGFAPAPVTPPAPAKASVALTVNASPEPAVVGSSITVKGTLARDGRAFAATTVLEHADDDSGTWSKVATVKAGTKGTLSATTRAVRSGSFRYRYAGDRTTDAGVSPTDHVEVRLAVVRLTVSAPSSVTKGKAVKVGGSIKREGKAFRAETTLEFRASGGDGWRRVKTVRSSSKGALSVSVTPTGSGDYRYRFVGNATTGSGASAADHVVVKPKPPARPKPKKYKNCTALTKVYPHGVGRPGAKDKGGDVTDFVRDTKTYDLNKKSDRDKDGIACER